MNTNKKLLLIVGSMLFLLMIAVVINVTLNFRDYSYQRTLEKAQSTAEFVRDGLTAHMVNGMMDKREFFLDSIKNRKDIKKFWIIRGENVIKQFGKGYDNELPKDAIDKEVLKTGKTIAIKTETANQVVLRITIPYIATAYGHPNCLECHNAKEGDVLGAISMEFDIESTRYNGIMTILKILGLNIIFLIIALYLINHFFKPITTLFSELGKMVDFAHKGDFSKRITHKFKGDEQAVIDKINTFFDKLEVTFIDLKKSLSTFVSHTKISDRNPLEESQRIVSELSNIYKFKKTIELDQNCNEIFYRIALILKEHFHINNFTLFLIDKEKNEKSIIIEEKEQSIQCNCSSIDSEANLCRAYRTGVEIFSSEFDNICPYNACQNDTYFICIPFEINHDIMIVIELFTSSQRRYEQFQSILENIKNYLEAAKPVLESKFLMRKLQDSSLRDGLTGLYNRRFLENFIEQFAKQADRAEKSYAILMIDIDHFKKVNDTYGHDVGDKVIKATANVLKSNIRTSDMAIRYGGEEFLVLLFNPNREKVKDIAQNIANKFKAIEFNAKGLTFTKTFSIGISYYPDQAESIWQAIKYADIALYKAKENGRDQIVEFKPEFLKKNKN